MGSEFSAGPEILEKAEVEEFAKKFDGQDFHSSGIGPAAALLKGHATSGWHTAALTMRMVLNGGLPFDADMIGLDTHLRWHKAAYVGDALTIKCRVLSVSQPALYKHAVLVKASCRTYANENRLVQTMKVRVLLVDKQTKAIGDTFFA